MDEDQDSGSASRPMINIPRENKFNQSFEKMTENKLAQVNFVETVKYIFLPQMQKITKNKETQTQNQPGAGPTRRIDEEMKNSSD